MPDPIVTIRNHNAMHSILGLGNIVTFFKNLTVVGESGNI